MHDTYGLPLERIPDVIANTVGALLGFTILIVVDALATRLREAGR